MLQTPAFSHCGIVPKNTPEAHQLAGEIAAWLQKQGCRATLTESGALTERDDYDLLTVLGGDGTLLATARRIAGRKIPLIGINLGNVGFLTEIPREHWRESLSTLLAGHGTLLPRLLLRWRLLHGNEERSSGMAVNDLVISRGALARLITLDLRVDGQHVCQVRADGLILSSPLGASGYAVSAGGPLVHPALEAVTITPICPFLCEFPPLVVPASLSVCVAVRRDAGESNLTVDGQEGCSIPPGDQLEVYGVPGGIVLASLRPEGYFERLRSRGFVQEHSGHIN